MSDLSLAKAGLPFDTLFVSSLFKGAIAIKAGVQAPESIRGQLIEDTQVGATAFHFLYEDTSFLLLAFDVSKEDLKRIVHPWLRSSTTLLWSLFMPAAQAQDRCTLRATEVGFRTVAPIASHIKADTTTKKIGECALSALRSAGNQMKETLQFFTGLATEPAKIWQEMKDSYTQLKGFVLNIQEELDQMFTALSGISVEEQAQITCSFTGTLISSSILALHTGKFVKLIPQMLLKMKEVSQKILALTKAENLGISLPNKKHLSSEIISCAL
ncbi:MAG: hypothetical protein AAGB31_15225 [Bdellovibrio sp.]